MKKIILSLGTIVVVGAVVAGATGAFYGDVETSTGNTFTAGSVELMVDSESHYNGMICTWIVDDIYQWQPGPNAQLPYYPEQGSPCEGTWGETDLGIHKFFYFTDLKPGDYGENTISLHVYDNDAWGQFVIASTTDRDNTCTDPEQEAEEGACVDPDGDGEIDDNLRFTAWLDQGSIPGFQCGNPELGLDQGARCIEDPLEGNNIYDEPYEFYIWYDTLIGDLGPFDLSVVFSEAYDEYDCDCADGHTDYGRCHGLAEDGRMVGSATYYFGLAWDLDLDSTGNEVQTDEYTADLIFQVEQYRNNSTPFIPTP